MNKTEKNPQIISAYEKAAQDGIDPRCIPQRLDKPVPEHNEIVYPNYSKEEIANWKFLYERQMKYLQTRVCKEYIDGMDELNLSPNKIPNLKELSNNLLKITGWKVARVPGLIHEQNFFELLRRKVFPSTDYIRGKEELDYTPAPDLFHDIFGHMPLLTNKNFAAFYQRFGLAASEAEGINRKYLETFHWFTVEFGLIRKPGGFRIYGAGIASSHSEVQHALSKNVSIRRFDPENIILQEYDVWHLQPILYAIDSFEQLEEGFKKWTKKIGLL
ncbi:MAG: phenylalanine 4-monooxygenase [Ignavibacteria bacterium]|nr:phenylalanine 4-monooxygenase [Ignavibacteria bacterium]